MADTPIHLVSGVTSGMGHAFAQQALAAGERVVGLVRSKDSAKDMGLTDIIEVDFSDPEAVAQCLASRSEIWNSFVNCAAILPALAIHECTPQSLKEIFNINVISPMLVCKQLIGKMAPQACILLVGSIAGYKGSYDDPYAATKGAIHSLVKSIALKFAPDVRVVGLAPGMTDGTRMTSELIPGRREQTLQTIPLRSAGRAEDMAALMHFLLRPECQFMTGAMVDINGGQYVR